MTARTPTPGPAAADDEEPDPRLLWRWAGAAVRPWIGWFFVGVGGLLVLLGYLGVSGEAIVEKQIPFLVSGGIGGVLLCVVGAYFLGTEELRKDSGRLDRLEHMVQELHEALLARPDAPTPRAPPSSNGHAVDTAVVVVEGGETYHRSGCAAARGKATTVLDGADLDDLADRGLRPCPLCGPVVAGRAGS